MSAGHKECAYYIYARKSSESDEKQVESIPRQVEICNELIARDDVTISDGHILTEERSAKIPGRRSVFNGLMETIEKNSHTTVYCWLFNRLSRNSREDGAVRYLIETGKLTVVTSRERFDEGTNSIVTAVEGAKATQDSRDLRKMVQDANERRRKHGICPGQPPPGYWWSGPHGRMCHAPDGERFVLIQRAVRLVLQGTRAKEALRILNEEWGFRTREHKKVGGGPLAATTWYETVLRNPYYCGKFISKGQWYNGTHESMITEEEYWRIQELLGRKGRARPSEYMYLPYLGLLRCGECNSTITRDVKKYVKCFCKRKYSVKHRDHCPTCGLPAEEVPQQYHHEYVYYRCTKQRKHTVVQCSQPYVGLPQLERQIAAYIQNITIPQEFVDWALECLNENNDEELAGQEAALKSLQAAYEAKQRELARMNQMYIKGFITEDEEADYREAKQQTLVERNRLKAQLDNLQKQSDVWRERTEQVFVFAKNAKEWFERGDNRTRTQILSSLGVNGKLLHGKLLLEVQPPFVVIENALNDIKTRFPGIEPENLGEIRKDKRQTETVAAIRTTWLPLVDTFRTRYYEVITALTREVELLKKQLAFSVSASP